MYSMFKTHENYKYINVSYDSYRRIFNHNFNISFKYPRVVSFSTSDEFKAKIKILQSENKENEMKQLTTENLLHNKKVNVFYARKSKLRKLANTDTSFLSICKDYQKNVSLPNISTNDEYYKQFFPSIFIHCLQVMLLSIAIQK